MTWDEYFKFCDSPKVCPYIGGSKHVLMTKDILTNLLVTDQVPTDDEMRLINEVMRPLGFVAVCLHPDHPFQKSGVYTRRSPEPCIQLTRLKPALAAQAALEGTDYYDDWPADDMMPGMEDLS